MKESSKKPEAAKLDLHDVLYMLSRHKIMILVLTMAGLAVGGYLYKQREPIFQSTAKLNIRYMVNRVVEDNFESEAGVGGKSTHILNTQMEALTSRDLAMEVAESVGPEKYLVGKEGEPTAARAAGVILGGLEVAVPTRGGTVIHVVCGNSDGDLAVETLGELIDKYREWHKRIYRSGEAFESIENDIQEVSGTLAENELKLGKLKAEAGFLSLEDATMSYSLERNQVIGDLNSARAELADLKARMGVREEDWKDREKAAGKPGEAKPPKAIPLEGDAEDKLVDDGAGAVDAQVLSRFRSLERTLEMLHQSDWKLQQKYAPGHRLLRLSKSQIDTMEGKRASMLRDYPRLEEDGITAIDPRSGLPTTMDGREQQLLEDKSRLAAINARISVFEGHLDELRVRFEHLSSIEFEIKELERRVEMEDRDLRELHSKLKTAKADQALDPSMMPNLTLLQTPSAPVKTYDEKMGKIILGISASGLIIGVGLALMLEMFVDGRVRRPIELETKLQVPLMMSIPRISMNGASRKVSRIEMAEDAAAGVKSQKRSLSVMVPDESQVFAVNGSEDGMMPYAEAIRDRIIFNFEMNNIVHKPKLVALAGLSEGAGNSSISRGLARAFAQTDGTKVLLVDLNSATAVDKGSSGETIVGVLEQAGRTDFREDRKKLYLASARARRGGSEVSSFAPKQLHDLLPHLRASDFDYIIFDMPPVDQTSPTLAMAGLMDKVLLVLDAENTSRESLKWGYSELSRGRADVSCVFNKARQGGLRWVPGDS